MPSNNLTKIRYFADESLIDLCIFGPDNTFKNSAFIKNQYYNAKIESAFNLQWIPPCFRLFKIYAMYILISKNVLCVDVLKIICEY